jgi:hypothetical protein
VGTPGPFVVTDTRTERLFANSPQTQMQRRKPLHPVPEEIERLRLHVSK